MADKKLLKSEELKEKYRFLYQKMIDSKDVKNMMLFGSIMSEMMEYLIEEDFDFAKKEIDKLESINWNQYLTEDEADKICRNMEPKCEWPFDVWKKVILQSEIEVEEKPIFNEYALWVVMNSMQLRHGDTIEQNVLELTAHELTPLEKVSMIHSLAIDCLKDKKFDVRKMFLENAHAS